MIIILPPGECEFYAVVCDVLYSDQAYCLEHQDAYGCADKAPSVRALRQRQVDRLGQGRRALR